ncbi:cobyric acid synthase [Chitinophaga sp. sic0106]|nr:cobyric acid synthase [Chitinophaga sp. sic0106]
MIVGTASDVGKSVITAGFCRIFRQDGYSPAPFKAQNMSLNSYATPDGLEIGRAQAVQAEAAGVPCSTDMNPVLLKPGSDVSAQLVLHGKPAGNRTAAEYFTTAHHLELFREVTVAYDRLAARYHPVVMEGAGSISEINLWDRDIVNMRMAMHANADVYLVADIDRGGIFGSIYGTLALLPPAQKALVKGIIINKFRGDIQLFEDGRRQLEQLTGLPVTGVLPYFRDIHIEEEDSVSLEAKHRRLAHDKVNIAVVLLRHMSNFTDFNALEKYEEINLFYTDNPADIIKADVVILPGSKNTIGDLMAIRSNGTASAVMQAAAAGKTVIGICGGYQMMGATVADPYGVEGEIREVAGLGLLPVNTVLAQEKTTKQRYFTFREHPETCVGYEIHMGTTTGRELCPVNILGDGSADGYWGSAKCWGTYLHGILDNEVVVKQVIHSIGRQISTRFDYAAFRQQQYDKLAALMREHLDLNAVYSSLVKQ